MNQQIVRSLLGVAVLAGAIGGISLGLLSRADADMAREAPATVAQAPAAPQASKTPAVSDARPQRPAPDRTTTQTPDRTTDRTPPAAEPDQDNIYGEDGPVAETPEPDMDNIYDEDGPAPQSPEPDMDNIYGEDGPVAETPEPDMDNIYHEDDNLADDADVFPRMAKTIGPASEGSNCRRRPWGEVVTAFGGGSFVEITDRTVDEKGDAWFLVEGAGCWLHQSRLGLQ